MKKNQSVQNSKSSKKATVIKKRFKIPEEIGDKGREWIKKVFLDFKDSKNEFNDSELEFIVMAAGCLDRIHLIGVMTKIYGSTVKDRFGEEKPYSLLSLECENKMTFLRICDQLGLVYRTSQNYR